MTSAKAGTEIASVPSKALLHLDRLPAAFRQLIGVPRMTVHAILAAFLTLGDAEILEGLVGPCRDLWPSINDLVASMPLLLAARLRRITTTADELPLLPPQILSYHEDGHNGASPVQGLLQKQEARFECDWEAICAAPGLPRPLDQELFRYHWLIVNTRSFYFSCGSLAKLKREDRMVLCPLVDLFNHANGGVGSSRRSCVATVVDHVSVVLNLMRRAGP